MYAHMNDIYIYIYVSYIYTSARVMLRCPFSSRVPLRDPTRKPGANPCNRRQPPCVTTRDSQSCLDDPLPYAAMSRLTPPPFRRHAATRVETGRPRSSQGAQQGRPRAGRRHEAREAEGARGGRNRGRLHSNSSSDIQVWHSLLRDALMNSRSRTSVFTAV